jgi:surface antigen
MGQQVIDYHGIEFCNQSKLIGKPVNCDNKNIGHASIVVKVLSIVLLCGTIAACSVAGSKTTLLESDASLITGSVSKSAEITGIESTDTEVIKSVVAEAKLKSSANMALAWVNPDTGSSGTITTIDRFLGSHGQKCRGFKTTVSTFMGVAFYNGETCQISPTEWVLSWFRPVDAKTV